MMRRLSAGYWRDLGGIIKGWISREGPTGEAMGGGAGGGGSSVSGTLDPPGSTVGVILRNKASQNQFPLEVGTRG